MARWTNVVALEASIAQMSGELAAVFDHARAYVRDFGASLSAKVEGRLDPLRAGLAPSERRRFDACIDTIFGRRRIYANECANLHFPFLPADEYFDRAHFPWLPDVEAMTEIVRSEFLALRGKADQALFQPYVELEEGTPDNKWSKLDHSRAWSACFLWRYGERIDAVCDICPQTAAMLESVNRYEMPGRGPTAFFSLLQPHTRLPAHTGVTNTRTIVHLPLIVPPHCGFRVGGETRPWEVGTAFAFDDTIEHEAWNESDEDRVVLIFDVWNPYLTEAEKTLLHALSLAMDTAGAMSGGVA